MFGASSGTFYRLVEKATSQLLLEPDWDSTIQICDCIRQGDVQPKYALQTLRKKIQQDNPHVSMYALQVLESCVKNCGTVIHEEVAVKEFMEFLKDLVKKRPDPVKAKILELVQVWSHAFRNEPSYKVVIDTYHLMKMEGYTFPTLKEADAMFKAEKAPEWKDGECCHRCRVQFSTFQRKHHCRHCGNIFCNKCSSKASIIPKFGLEREVRVCEACFEEINVAEGKKTEDGLPQEYVNSPLSQQSQTPAAKSEQDSQEEEEYQLALALSKSEAEAKEKERNRMKSSYTLYGGNAGDKSNKNSEPIYAQPTKVTAPVLDTSDMDPELARYLNRNYWQQKHDDVKTSTTQPSAPTAVAETKMSTGNSEKIVKIEEKYQNGETTNNDQEEFLNALRGSIEIFVNRMKSNSARGRSIATDSSVQSLFMTINAMHPQLMKNLSEMEDSRSHYETLQDKLAQLKDAREALDALREEHREKRRREQEELERQRQIQMAQKLDILRQKKQEYLEFQRQLALQRMQEQEREMQMRFEQQKQMQHMRAQNYVYSMYPQPPTFSPGGSTEGSPLHQAHQAGMPPQTGYTQGPGAMGGAPMGMTMAPGGTTGAPGAPGVQVPPGAMQPPSQPMYNQPGYQQPPQQIPGGYQQPPPGGYPATTYPGGGVPGQYQHMGQPGGPPGQPPPPQGDFNSFNMQNMNNSLPNQGQPVPQHQGGGLPPQQLPGQQYMPPGQGQYLPPGAQPIPQQPAQQAQPQPAQQPAVTQNDAQLISFD